MKLYSVYDQKINLYYSFVIGIWVKDFVLGCLTDEYTRAFRVCKDFKNCILYEYKLGERSEAT